jgi:hypothetical protein
MATARKILIRPGIYHPPQGELVASRERIKGWVDTWKRMDAAGLKIPVSWGHQPGAVPGDAGERAARQYYLSHYNAGYVGSLDADEKGDLASSLNVPGCEVDASGNLTHWLRLPDGRQVKASVGEVSIAIKDFRDGQGREWPDAIVHVALTPLPVVDSQEGFKALGLDSCDNPVYLSLSQLLSASEGADMAEEKEKPDVESEEAEPKAKAPPEAEAEAPAPAAPPVKNHFAAALEVLRANGIALPEDTTEKNLCERILVAGTAIASAKAEMEQEMAKSEAAEGGEEKGQEYSGEQPGEEPRPVMMSLSTAKTPAERKLLERETKSHKAGLDARIDRLVKRGLKPARAAELRQQVQGYTLSLDAEGEPVPSRVDYALSLLEDSLPESREFRKHIQGRATLEARPDRGEDRTQIQEEAGDELAALAGAPIKKK